MSSPAHVEVQEVCARLVTAHLSHLHDIEAGDIAQIAVGDPGQTAHVIAGLVGTLASAIEQLADLDAVAPIDLWAHIVTVNAARSL